MRWYYQALGGHTHVRVFMNGGKCGDLCFRNEEFKEVMTNSTLSCRDLITFIQKPSSHLFMSAPRKNKYAAKPKAERADDFLHIRCTTRQKKAWLEGAKFRSQRDLGMGTALAPWVIDVLNAEAEYERGLDHVGTVRTLPLRPLPAPGKKKKKAGR